MTLVVLVALGLLSLAVGLAEPVARLELRSGRSTWQALRAEVAAEAGLAELERGGWIVGAAGVAIGASVALPTVTPRTGTTVAPAVWRLGPSLWLGESVAELRDRGGGLLAAARRGLLFRVRAVAPDTVPRAWPTSRPWVVGFQ